MIIGLLSLIIAILCFALGIVVCINNSKRPLNISFSIFSILISFWVVGLYLYEYPLLFDNLFWLRFVYLMVILFFIPFMYFSFCLIGKMSFALISVVSYALTSMPFVYLIISTNFFKKIRAKKGIIEAKKMLNIFPFRGIMEV